MSFETQTALECSEHSFEPLSTVVGVVVGLEPVGKFELVAAGGGFAMAPERYVGLTLFGF